jgi:hypothetical protein
MEMWLIRLRIVEVIDGGEQFVWFDGFHDRDQCTVSAT